MVILRYVLFAAAGALLAAPPVKVESGFVSGVEEDGMLVYRGVPYAAPPVGDLRWRAPRPAATWKGVRTADKFGPECVQAKDGEKSEDCLTVNIWTPAAKPAAPLPVMVWIHGGGFRAGNGRMSGAGLVPEGVILVGIQYRLGYFGGFAHPGMTKAQEGEPLGNYGLMDQIAALGWVRRNIAAFGGDPARVTIFGESAGGSSVLYLMASPAARGLFNRAICESGGGSRKPHSLADLEAAGAKTAADLGVASEADPIARLRNIPAEELTRRMDAARQKAGERVASSEWPVIDGKVVTGSPAEVFEAGKQAPVPLIIGANSYEGTLVASAKPAPFSGPAPVRSAYEAEAKGDAHLLAGLVFGDEAFVGPARVLARAMRTVKQPAWLYHFSYVRDNQRGKVPGAGHATEIQFINNTVKGTPRDRKMAERASAYWVRFAATGDPNGAGKTHWPAYAASTDRLLEFGDEIAVRTGFRKLQLDYLEEQWRTGATQ